MSGEIRLGYRAALRGGPGDGMVAHFADPIRGRYAFVVDPVTGEVRADDDRDPPPSTKVRYYYRAIGRDEGGCAVCVLDEIVPYRAGQAGE